MNININLIKLQPIFPEKRTSKILSSGLILSFILFFSTSFSQSKLSSCSKINLVETRMNQIHIQPVEISGTAKKEIISIFFKSIDEDNIFFTKEDILDVQKTTELDLCQAFRRSIQIYELSLKRYDSIMKQYLSVPITFLKDEKITTNKSENEHLRASSKEYTSQLEKFFKHQILLMAYDHFSEDSLKSRVYTSELDSKLRKELMGEESKFLERMFAEKEDFESILIDEFLNAMTLRYDPHSSYFSPEEKEDMEVELSSEVSVFGIQFVENDDFEIEITDVTPGSSAWNSNMIFKGDIIEELEDKKGKKYPLKNKGMAYVSSILGQPAVEEMIFYMRNKSGVVTKAKIIKTKIENIDNSFTGYVLSDATAKVGYISLPSFYSDFESDFQLGCANDVAKEILLLKKDSIQGLILDLRNNGGGSLKEAVELSGLFIDEGPMSIYQQKNSKPYLLKDMNRGTVYDGPLIVLVNSMSASASEFFAGCMQDYHRALIVGDQTFGKGTAQSVFPLDSMDFSGVNGFVKVTQGKFYHVSSRSNQSIGITPEVVIEDIYSGIDYYLEKNQPYFLQNDSTKKKVVFTTKNLFFTDEMIQKSNDRIRVSEDVKRLKNKALELKEKVEQDQAIPLDFNTFLTYADSEKKYWDDLYKSSDLQSTISISNHSFAKKMLSYQENEKKFNDEIIKNLEKDILLKESFLIFKDLFTFAK